MGKKNEITSPFSFAPLSQISNPGALVKEPGDYFMIKVTKTGKRVAKLRSGNVGRSTVQHKKGGRLVDYISHD